MRIFINNRDLLTWPSRMAALLKEQGHEVVWIDNASTYPPLLKFYETCPYEVRRLRDNRGPGAPWQVMERQTEPYVVTDPDLGLEGIPKNWPDILLDGLEIDGVKCGFSIYDQDLPKASAARHFDDPELQRVHDSVWDRPVTGRQHGYFRYPVDTQFAVYDPEITVHRIGGCRAAPPYIARHLSWHVVPAADASDPAMQIPLDEEYAYYIRHATNGSSMQSFAYVQQMIRNFQAVA